MRGVEVINKDHGEQVGAEVGARDGAKVVPSWSR
jgi:hypothetical protein